MVKFMTCIVMCVFSQIAFSETTPTRVVKIAILDTLISEKIATHKYVLDYHKGLHLAHAKTREKGIAIEYKVFEYSKEPMAILKVLPSVKDWHPHLIVGPRASNLFLLLKDQFKNILVISPLATANDVAKLPENFYSISPSNEIQVKALVSFSENRFSTRPIQPVVEQDCKNCVDFVDNFIQEAKTTRLKISQIEKSYMENEVETLEISKLLKGVAKDAVFLIPNRSYTSGVLMGRIANEKKQNDIVFLGGDGWGDWSSGYTGKFRSQFKYKGYRLAPWSLDVNDESVRQFHKEFRKVNGTEPTGTISYISYRTVMTAIQPTLEAKEKNFDNETILQNFLSTVKINRNYGRPKSFGVYELNQEGEELIQTFVPGNLL